MFQKHYAKVVKNVMTCRKSNAADVTLLNKSEKDSNVSPWIICFLLLSLPKLRECLSWLVVWLVDWQKMWIFINFYKLFLLNFTNQYLSDRLCDLVFNRGFPITHINFTAIDLYTVYRGVVVNKSHSKAVLWLIKYIILVKIGEYNTH